jgi:hypothetical protein
MYLIISKISYGKNNGICLRENMLMQNVIHQSNELHRQNVEKKERLA